MNQASSKCGFFKQDLIKGTPSTTSNPRAIPNTLNVNLEKIHRKTTCT